MDLIPSRIQIRNLHISKIRFLFPVSFAIEYKVDIAEFYLYMGFGADLLKNMVTRAWKLPKIGIRTPLQSTNYFRFVSQTTGDEATTFLSRMKNLVKIGKESWTHNRSRTDLFTNTDWQTKTDDWVYPMRWRDNKADKQNHTLMRSCTSSLKYFCIAAFAASRHKMYSLRALTAFSRLSKYFTCFCHKTTNRKQRWKYSEI